MPHTENQQPRSLKFKVHQGNTNKSKPEAGYFAKGLKESSKIGANCCTGKLITWKLPRKRMCSSNQSFISTTGVWCQQIGKPKCRHAARAGQREVLTHRTTMQQVLEMQKAKEAVASLDLVCRGKLQQELKIQLWKRNTRLHSAAGSSCLDAEPCPALAQGNLLHAARNLRHFLNAGKSTGVNPGCPNFNNTRTQDL